MCYCGILLPTHIQFFLINTTVIDHYRLIKKHRQTMAKGPLKSPREECYTMHNWTNRRSKMRRITLIPCKLLLLYFPFYYLEWYFCDLTFFIVFSISVLGFPFFSLVSLSNVFSLKPQPAYMNCKNSEHIRNIYMLPFNHFKFIIYQSSKSSEHDLLQYILCYIEPVV